MYLSASRLSFRPNRVYWSQEGISYSLNAAGRTLASSDSVDWQEFHRRLAASSLALTCILVQLKMCAT